MISFIEKIKKQFNYLFDNSNQIKQIKILTNLFTNIILIPKIEKLLINNPCDLRLNLLTECNFQYEIFLKLDLEEISNTLKEYFPNIIYISYKDHHTNDGIIPIINIIF